MPFALTSNPANYRADAAEWDKALNDCFQWIVRKRAYEIWQSECNQLGQLVHGNHEEHWYRALEEVKHFLPNGPVDSHLVRFFRQQAIKEGAYAKWLKRCESPCYGDFSGSAESDWFDAERELTDEFTTLTQDTDDPETIGFRDLSNLVDNIGWKSGRHLLRFCGLQIVSGLLDAFSTNRVKDDGVSMMSELNDPQQGDIDQKQCSPLNVLSPQQISDLEGHVLAVNRSGEILASAETKSELFEIMKARSDEYWHFHPGVPVGGRLTLPPVPAE